MAFARCRLDRVDLSGARLERLRLVDCAIAAGNLANVAGRGAELTRVELSGSRLTGLSLTEAVLSDVTVRDCRVDLASFAGSGLRRVTFEECLMTGADFAEARLESVRFHGCGLGEADFRGARLTRCELRRCELGGLHGAQSLRGAALPWPEIVANAGTWAAALGIELLDGE